MTPRERIVNTIMAKALQDTAVFWDNMSRNRYAKQHERELFTSRASKCAHGCLKYMRRLNRRLAK